MCLFIKALLGERIAIAMKKVKLLMVAPVPPPYGGIANWTLLSKNYLSHNNSIVLLPILNIAPKIRNLDGRTIWDRIVVQGIGMLKQNKMLKYRIKQEHPDVIHITTSGQLAIIRDILFLKTAKKYRILTAYHIRFGRIPEIAKAKTYEWKLMNKALHIADTVIAIDHRTEASIRKYAPKANVCYIPNPFDVSKMAGEETAKEKREIVFLGWVVKTKGIEELLLAWSRICETFPDWILRIVGPYSDEYLTSLKQNYSKKQVMFEGEKKHEDAMKLLAGAAIFVLPSYTEGFPNAVLEAMALEKPIIATNVGAIPDMLKDCGIIIPKKEVNALENALVNLMGDTELRVKLGSAAKKKVLREFSMEKVFSQYMDVWKGR